MGQSECGPLRESVDSPCVPCSQLKGPPYQLRLQIQPGEVGLEELLGCIGYDLLAIGI